jgi:hypothetical protein
MRPSKRARRRHTDPRPSSRSGFRKLSFRSRTRAQPYWCYQGSRVAEVRAFSENSLGNYLDELIDEGLVQHVDPAALANRRVIDADPDDRGYYLITRAGAEEVNDNQGDELASELLRR